MKDEKNIGIVWLQVERRQGNQANIKKNVYKILAMAG